MGSQSSSRVATDALLSDTYAREGGPRISPPPRARARSLSLSLERLVESWAEGCAWNELLASTSLAEGDVCRLVRRTIDVLRSFAVCAELPARVRDNARAASEMLDRPPVADEATALPLELEPASADEASSPLDDDEGLGDDGDDDDNEGLGDEPRADASEPLAADGAPGRDDAETRAQDEPRS